MNYYKILKYSSVIGGTVCGIFVLRSQDLKPLFKNVSCENEATKSNDTSSEPALKLKMVQLFYRHGARTPLHTIPNVNEAIYDKDIFMGQIPHTLFDYNVTTLNGESRPYSRYENYLSKRFVKANYINDAFSGQVPHTKFNFKTMTLDGGPKPYSGYDNYYIKNMLKGGSHVGSLTHLGQDQMYMIGKELRKQYINKLGFIDPVYNPEQIHVRSTNIHRTIRTARCILAGMFGKDSLNKLEEPPIIYVQDSNIDELLPRPSACKVLRQINHSAMIHGGDHPDIKDDRLRLESALGLPPDGTKGKKKIQFIEVRDDIRAREVHGFRIPDVLEPHLDSIEKNANLLMYFAFCGQHEAERMLAMRLSNGPLLRLMMNNIANRNNSSQRFYLYSCHDSSLVALLAALDIYDKQWPPFGADMRFEIYEDSNKKEYIKVSYCGKDKIVRGCKSEMCPLSDFKQAMEPYKIEEGEYKEVCASNILDSIAKEMVELEKGEVEDTETKAKSEIAAGM